MISVKKLLAPQIRSALYIDGENIGLPAETLVNWLAWLEDGEFDGQKPRRFLAKRIYWNSNSERHKDIFEAHGFEVILCDKFSGLRNGADIRMAMDIVESTHTLSRIDEYILVTRDSDFVSVLNRLREKHKATAIVADESRPEIHTTMRHHADILIPMRRLVEARTYIRLPAKRGILARIRRRQPVASPSTPRSTTSLPTKPVAASPRGARTGRIPAPPVLQQAETKKPRNPPPTAATETALTDALARVVKLARSRKPNTNTGRKSVMAELAKVPGFKPEGTGRFLGFGGYYSLLQELARRDPRLVLVTEASGGIAMKFTPHLGHHETAEGGNPQQPGPFSEGPQT